LVETHDFLHTPAFSVGGHRRNIAITFRTEKLDWCAWLPDDMFSRLDTIPAWDAHHDVFDYWLYITGEKFNKILWM